jgi:hypothetical protein
VDITPRCETPSYQMFAGRGGISGDAPLRTVSRYVPERTLAW